jgi:hypothetical protein
MKNLRITTIYVLNTLALLSVPIWGSQKLLAGRVFAYDPIEHMGTLMNLTDVDSKEVIILDTGKIGKDRFVKIEIYAYDRHPLAKEAFDGKIEVHLHARRSAECDEKKPNILPPEDTSTKSGQFLVTAAYRDATAMMPGPLTCYVARTDRSEK